MNSRAQPPRTAGGCGVGLRLLLGLIPCLAAATPPRAPDPSWPARSRPYLAVLGSSTLRIQAATPPPDLNAHLPAGAPPQPAPAAIVSPMALSPPVPSSAPAEPTPESITPTTESTPAPVSEEKPAKTFKSILPDDTRQKVRAEDFLPFFQPPGANPNPNDVTVVPTPPAPGIQPPSSATYRQQ